MRHNTPELIELPDSEGPTRIGGQRPGHWWVGALVVALIALVAVSFSSKFLAGTPTTTATAIAAPTTPSLLAGTPASSDSPGPLSPVVDPTFSPIQANGGQPLLDAPAGWTLARALSSSASADGDWIGVGLTPGVYTGPLAVHVVCYGYEQLEVFLFMSSDRPGAIPANPSQAAIFYCAPDGNESRVVFPDQTLGVTYDQIIVEVVGGAPSPSAGVGGELAPGSLWLLGLEVPITS